MTGGITAVETVAGGGGLGGLSRGLGFLDDRPLGVGVLFGNPGGGSVDLGSWTRGGDVLDLGPPLGFVDGTTVSWTDDGSGGIDTIRTTLASWSLAEQGKGEGIERLEFIGTGSFNGTGNWLNNTIIGGGGGDRLDGGEGNDLLDGGAGADTMIGGTGDDTFRVDSQDDITREGPGVLTWAGTGYRVTTGGTDTVETGLGVWYLDDNVENLTFLDLSLLGGGMHTGVGNELHNVMTGTAGVEHLWGNDGNDVLDGRGGADIMTGGVGSDVYHVDHEGDVVNEMAYDSAWDGYHETAWDAGSADDQVVTSLAFYSLENIVNHPSGPLPFLSGPAVRGQVENLTYSGDALFTGRGNTIGNVIVGGVAGGDERGDNLAGLGGNDRLYGRAGADNVSGGAGADLHDLGDHNDTAFVDNGDATGADVVLGGTGWDRVQADFDLAGGLTVNLFASGTPVAGEVLTPFTTSAIDVEEVQGSGDSDRIDASRLASGLISIFGHGGEDIYVAGGVAGSFDGGEGADTIMLAGTLSRYAVMPASSDGRIFWIEDRETGVFHTVTDVETMRFADGTTADVAAVGSRRDGTEGDDTIIVPMGVRTVMAHGGADTVYGDVTTEYIDGGAGPDALYGGGGHDTLIGGLGDDFLVYRDGVTVDGGEGWDRAVADEHGTDGGVHFIVFGTNVESVSGRFGDDVIDARGVAYGLTMVGYAGDDIIHGGDGDDAVLGFEGDDQVFGGAGFDQILGGAGNDVLDGGTRGIYGDRLYGEAGDDTLIGSNESMLLGGTGNDTIRAGAGAYVRGDEGDDIIVGSAGTQQILGGTGSDTLTGGTDFDRFDFEDAWGDDVITDFEVGIDQLGLHTVGGLDRLDQLTITDTAGGAEIAFGTDTILLRGVLAAQLTESAFLL